MSISEEVKAYVAGVEGVVEATSFERGCLWERHQKRGWVSETLGYGVEVGSIGEDPIFISILTARVGGKKILFYEATSLVVDHAQVNLWLHTHLPNGTPRTDAQNFHTIL